MDAVKRKYDAPLRRQQAAATKRLITQAAVAEFSEHGWAGTTVGAIAARAGVTPQAVHVAMGPKAALLIRAVETTVAGDSDDLPLADRSAFDDVYAPSASSSRRLVALAAASTDIYRRAARLFLVLQEAALTDPAAAELASQAAARRLADHQRLAALLLPEGSPEQSADLADAIWALAGPGLYVDLVHRRSWTDEQYRHWLSSQLQQALRQAHAVRDVQNLRPQGGDRRGELGVVVQDDVRPPPIHAGRQRRAAAADSGDRGRESS